MAENYKILKKDFLEICSLIYFLVALSMWVLSMWVVADISKEPWPKRKIWINIESLVFVKELSISFIYCTQEGESLISKQGAVKKKNCVFVSTSRPHEQNGLKVSWKLCLNLCSRKWLGPKCSLVRYLIPLHLWQLNTLFGDDLINRLYFWKHLRLVALRR